MVTPSLFRAFPDAHSMAEADETEVYEYIKSVSYPNAKARHLVQLSRMLVEDYGGEVPSDMDALMRLLAMPLVLASPISFVIMLGYIPVIAKRIKNEEEVLEHGLEGYAEYKKRVKYRMIPLIW